MTGLAAHKLTCIKRDRVLFNELDFSLARGELIYLRGPNGAGKTSLLRILTGLSEPDNGEVRFNECNINAQRDEFHRQMIYVGHKPGINGALTAMENLQFWCAQHQAPFDRNKTYKVLSNLGLVGMEDVPVRMLSAGQTRRVALARLWLKEADFWILDEPFTALDTDGIALLEKHIQSHVANNGAVITTSHQPLSELAGPHRELCLEYNI